MLSRMGWTVIALGVALSSAGSAKAQDQPGMPAENRPRVEWMTDDVVRAHHEFFGPQRDVHIKDHSWIYIDIPEAREIKSHDIVTIIVSEKSEVTANSRFNRQRTSTLKAELKEFIRIGPDGRLLTAAANQPTIDSNLQGRFQTTGQLSEQEGVTYRIAATVVDVLPNGNIVLEARKSIRTNRDVWNYSLTGIARHADITPNNTILSENIANLVIEKTQKGKVYNSTKRPWGTLLYDWFSPF